MKKEINTGYKGHTAWLNSRFKIQEKQYGFCTFPCNFSDHYILKKRLGLQALVRKVRSLPTLNQQSEIILSHSELQEQFDVFQKQAAKTLSTVSDDEDDSWDDASLHEVYLRVEFDNIDEKEDDNGHALSAKAANEFQQDPTNSSSDLASDSCIYAEHIALHLPSHLGCKWCNDNAAEDLANAELHLWEGQLNNALHHI